MVTTDTVWDSYWDASYSIQEYSPLKVGGGNDNANACVAGGFRKSHHKSDLSQTSEVMLKFVLLTTIMYGAAVGSYEEFLGLSNCPLRFSFAFQPSPICRTPNQNGYELVECCTTALSYLSQTIAAHINSTQGQTLFLNSTAEKSCVEDVHAFDLGINFNTCRIDPPLYTAYTSPCNFGKVDELKQNLSILNSSFSDILDSCSSPVNCSTCMERFTNASLLLSKELNDSHDTCGTALLVSLASTDIYDPTWVSSLYRCLKLPFPSSSVVGHSGKAPHRKIAEMCLIAICVAATFLILTVAFFLLRRKRIIPQHAENDEEESSKEEQLSKKEERDHYAFKSESLYAFSKKELFKATDNFSDVNYIGKGSAGQVHKGVLPSGQLVAIKHINNEEKKVDTFFKEVENLSKVRHPNLVTLFGYCQNGEDHYLIYEYCSKGNLWQWLFSDTRSLTWEQRVNIAVGCARGLWFLHSYPGGAIVHRDIKPTNILLNDKMDAKLSDFGLSKFIEMEESRVFTEVKGTAGYLDPEYMTRGQLTLASDVFSLGIVLLQLVSGRRPIDLDPGHRYSLITSAKKVVEKENEILKFIDPGLSGNFSRVAARNMTELGVNCASPSSHSRPSINEIKHTLEEVWFITTSKDSFTSKDSSKMLLDSL